MMGGLVDVLVGPTQKERQTDVCTLPSLSIDPKDKIQKKIFSSYGHFQHI